MSNDVKKFESDVDLYKRLITDMVNKLEDKKFLSQVYTIVMLHNERHDGEEHDDQNKI